MATSTGNGSSAAFLGWTQYGSAMVTLSIDMGTSSRPTLRYTPLKSTGDALEIAKPGDSITSRTLLIRGLLNSHNIDSFGPDLEGILYTDDCTVSLPTALMSFRDTGHFESIEGPNLIVDELTEVSVMFVCSNEGAGRGWASS